MDFLGPLGTLILLVAGFLFCSGRLRGRIVRPYEGDRERLGSTAAQ